MQNINICLHWLRKPDATACVFNARTQTFIKIHSLFPYNRPRAFLMYPGARLILICRLFQFNKWPWQLLKVTGLEKLGGVRRVKCSFLASWLITSSWLLYFSMEKQQCWLWTRFDGHWLRAEWTVFWGFISTGLKLINAFCGPISLLGQQVWHHCWSRAIVSSEECAVISECMTFPL